LYVECALSNCTTAKSVFAGEILLSSCEVLLFVRKGQFANAEKKTSKFYIGIGTSSSNMTNNLLCCFLSGTSDRKPIDSAKERIPNNLIKSTYIENK